MTDIKTDKNNEILKKAVESLQLRFRVAEISRATNESKGNISNFLHDKKPVSDEFLQTFSKAFDIDLREFGSTKGLKRIKQKENPQPKEEGFLQRHYEKIIGNYIDLVDRMSRDTERIQKELDLERSKNNKK